MTTTEIKQALNDNGYSFDLSIVKDDVIFEAYSPKKGWFIRKYNIVLLCMRKGYNERKGQSKAEFARLELLRTSYNEMILKKLIK